MGALIGPNNDRLVCDDCIIRACDQYTAANALPPESALSTLRYRQSLRRIVQAQKQAQAEMAQAIAENPDIAFPNRGLDGKPD